MPSRKFAANISAHSFRTWHHFVSVPSLRNYADRVVMFAAIGKEFSTQTMFVRNCTEGTNTPTTGPTNAKYLYAPPTGACAGKLHSYMKATSSINPHYPTIVHDTLSPTFSSLIRLRHVLRQTKNTKCFVSLYFPSTKFYHSKDTDPVWMHLSERQRACYSRLYLSRTLQEWLATKVADGIIGNSEEICQSLHSHYGYPMSKMCVVPGELDVERYKFRPDAKEQLTKYGIPTNAKIVLYVGSIQARKEPDLLLCAMEQVHLCNDKNVHLVMCGKFESGTDPTAYTLLHAASENPWVHYVGPQQSSDLTILYSAADCFVHPGRWEGSPRTVKEAMAYGCNVVAADISGVRAVDPTGQFIDYFCPGDCSQLAELIATILSSKVRDVFTQQSYLKKHYSPIASASRYVDFYRRVVAL